MIVLDTNVISELFRRDPSPAVEARLRTFPSDSFFTTAISESEIRFGLAILPAGRRRHALQARVEEILREVFSGRILPFDSSAAKAYSQIAGQRRAAGRPISLFYAQIAAITQAHAATLVTRNMRDFEGCGFTVINPWNPARA
jgi:predicted nucleic acid-binding protein